MPNPYHDEAGRFSSKEEMGAAVDRLYASIGTAKNPVELAEATDAWFDLRNEYEAAQKHETAGAVGSFIHDSTEAKRSGAPAANLVLQGIDPESAQIALEKGIRTGLATVGISQSRSTSGYTESKDANEVWREEYAKIPRHSNDLNEYQIETLTKLLKRGPQSLREDFYRTSTPDVKVAVMKGYMGHPLDSVRVSASLARGLMVNGGENNLELVSYALSSDLPFAEKAALADNHGRLAYIAARDPHAFTDRAGDPEIEQALITELRRHARSGSVTDEQRGGWRALALGSELNSTRDEIIEKFAGYNNYDRSIVDELAQNKHLTSQQRVEVLQSVAWNDAQHFSALAPRVAGKAYSVKDAAHKADSEVLYKVADRYWEIVKSGDTSGYVQLNPTQLRSAREQRDFFTEGAKVPFAHEQKARLAHFEAVLDAQEGEYNALKHQIEDNEKVLKKNYTEAIAFPTTRLKRRLDAATAVRAADIAAGEYADRYYSA